MKAESYLKGAILSHGVAFTEKALLLAAKHHSKGQNLCYNLPNAQDAFVRPQELKLKNKEDGYETVVSCVAPHKYRAPIVLDASDDIFFVNDANFTSLTEQVQIETLPEPTYYSHVLSNGALAKEYVSACGYDELNILPWHGCSISKQCAFCGINKISSLVKEKYRLTASEISHAPSVWEKEEANYLSILSEALLIARNDEIYSEHLHPIMISGNLSDSLLDFESEIYARIAKKINPILKGYATEGIIAVIEPPPSDASLKLMHDAGIETVVFNIEIACEPWSTEYCPGKNIFFKDYVLQRLFAALPIFGEKHVWSNFVLGLEPIAGLLGRCEELAKHGIVPSANVFHSDSGSRLFDFPPPSVENIIDFFNSLADIYDHYGLKPFYCSKALRTSLSNEAYEGRLKK